METLQTRAASENSSDPEPRCSIIDRNQDIYLHQVFPQHFPSVSSNPQLFNTETSCLQQENRGSKLLSGSPFTLSTFKSQTSKMDTNCRMQFDALYELVYLNCESSISCIHKQLSSTILKNETCVDTPVTKERSIDTPTRREISRYILSETSIGTPPSNEPIRDTSIRNETSIDTKTNELHIYTPTTSETFNDTPTRSETCNDKPTRSETCNYKPTRSETCNDTPTRSETCNDTPTRSEMCNDKPTRSETCDDKPPRSETCNDTPTRSKTCNGTPIKNHTSVGTPTKYDTSNDTSTRNDTSCDPPTRNGTRVDTPMKNKFHIATPMRNKLNSDMPTGNDTDNVSPTRIKTNEEKHLIHPIHVPFLHRMLLSLTILLGLCPVSLSLTVTELSVYDSMCSSNLHKIAVVRDCKGYIQCVTNGVGKLSATWVVCPSGQLFDPSRMECIVHNRCMAPKETAAYICPSTPLLKFSHPSSCALFYDCSRSASLTGLTVWENECPQPLLFDETTLACVEKGTGNSQLCGSRPEPKGKCDYRLGCLGKNCTGLDDGLHHDTLHPFSENYYVCKNGSVLDQKTCEEEGHIFDPHVRECTDTIHDDSVNAFCGKNPTAIFADPSRCSLLYDCSQATWHNNLKPYQTECSYPRMFDTSTLSCAHFGDVTCGHRLHTVQPCDYIVGHCIDAGCIPCVASCLGLRDGLNAYPGRVLTAFYLVCQHERTIDIRTCPEGTIFDPQMHACLNEISPQTLDVYCKNNPNGRLLHPSECSVFYSCNQSNSTQLHPNLPLRAFECKYPYLVDAGTISCKPHTLVRCGARREPFSPCDYVSNRCTSKSCTRCEQVMPSCYGKTNNYYPAINQEMTADYIICKDQRVMGIGTCPNGTIFDIRTLTCTDTIYQLSLVEYCTNYHTGRVQNPSNCAQYYDCAESLKDVKECTYPNLFDVASHLCLPYEQVNCTGRPVYLEPCDSFTFCAVQPCPYCNSAYPSCVGRNGQVGGFHFEPSMYYECVDDRLKLKYCQATFNTTTKACNGKAGSGTEINVVAPTTPAKIIDAGPMDSPDNIRLTCQLNPRLIHLKVDNCAQFYNCSLENSPLGDHTDECPVGQLFSAAMRRCVPQGEASCHGRYQPTQVCDYQKMCSNQTANGCAVCRETYPTCPDLANGAVLTNESFSNVMVYCENGRVMNVTTCPIGQFYDNIRQICTSVLTWDIASSACKRQPNQLLPHPIHCARYIRCSVTKNVGNSDKINFTIGECPYPLLFSDGLCRSYKTAKCGHRNEPITPCEYEELRKCPGNGSRCLVDSSHTCPDKHEQTCTDCELRYPTCLGSPNGFVPYPNRLFTPDFIKCDQQRTLSILKCANSIFDPDAKRCGLQLDIVTTEARVNTLSFCRKYSKALIPHSNHCARYYNCSAPDDRGVSGVSHLQECPHPQLFNSDLRICQNFIEVLNTAGCGKKFQPKHYCDYSSICPSQRFPTCTECRNSLPSCERQANGIHGNPPGNATTKGFMYCVEGRVLATSLCPPGSEFQESVRSCVSRPTAPRPGRG